MRHWWTLSICALGTLFWQCSDEAQQVQPAAQGQRGEACQARNDCEQGLACILGVCSRNDFELTSSAKHCDRVDCQVDADCCGNRPREAPAKCENRTSICQQPSLPGCITTTCTSSASCGAGSCPTGICSNSLESCTSNTDCADPCVEGFCAVSGFACVSDLDCNPGTCSTRYCSCANPDYNPGSAICTDPDCVNLCTLKCSEERCVQDNSCETDDDCPLSNLSICSAGSCVQCVTDDDCETSEGEECRSNVCTKPCIANEQCPLFHSCSDGDCVETGCQSDRECVLAANMGGQNGGLSNQDARLSKCLPSDEDPQIKACKVPCENDGACASEFQICDAGYCRFIGCETDDECRGYLGIANEMVTDARPYISRAVCRL